MARVCLTLLPLLALCASLDDSTAPVMEDKDASQDVSELMNEQDGIVTEEKPSSLLGSCLKCDGDPLKSFEKEDGCIEKCKSFGKYLLYKKDTCDCYEHCSLSEERTDDGKCLQVVELVSPSSQDDTEDKRRRSGGSKRKQGEGIVQMEYRVEDVADESPETQENTSRKRKSKSKKSSEGSLMLQDSSSPRRRIGRAKDGHEVRSKSVEDSQEAARFGFLLVILTWAGLLYYLKTKQEGEIISKWIKWFEDWVVAKKKRK
eukprot:CAMPEP_0167744444 /NCGR_PEP_ID=MMETSP0110_2-20121227/2596_1 /TAXON_ID=629695 /ORGANISM="Gymnochlora sp., Strain CCMP2014" /LENGTH=259 /DNA_ID=CAMNT_0007628969 /DNA_START=1399 /DNA_END=2175 /DNA_ORIENTATION=-